MLLGGRSRRAALWLWFMLACYFMWSAISRDIDILIYAPKAQRVV